MAHANVYKRQALDAGAEDFSEEEDSYEILTAPDDFSAVREALEKAVLPIAEAQDVYKRQENLYASSGT